VRPRPAALPTAALALAALAALPFALHSLRQGIDGIDGVQAVPTRLFRPDLPLANFGIFAHMIAGALITVLAITQAVPAIRKRWPAAHRVSGRIVTTAALLTAAGGLVYIAAAGTIGGPGMSAGFALYGALMAAAAVMTWRTARAGARARARHRRWGLRLVWLAMGSWLYRVQYGIWYAATGGAGSTPIFDGPFDQAMFVGFFLPHLLLLELWLRRRVEPAPARG
jgi:hypothetical protein